MTRRKSYSPSEIPVQVYSKEVRTYKLMLELRKYMKYFGLGKNDMPDLLREIAEINKIKKTNSRAAVRAATKKNVKLALVFICVAHRKGGRIPPLGKIYDIFGIGSLKNNSTHLLTMARKHCGANVMARPEDYLRDYRPLGEHAEEAVDIAGRINWTRSLKPSSIAAGIAYYISKKYKMGITQDEVARDFGVSNVSVRKVLKLIQGAGLVEKVPWRIAGRRQRAPKEAAFKKS